MSTETGTSLRLSRIIKADRETVFKAWTEPDQIKRWSCPEGLTVADSEVDLTVGGRYRLRMESPEGKVHTAVGVYREIVPPRRLVYTWDWEEESMGETLVTVELNDLGDSTEVMLTHEFFPTPELKGNHAMGWASCLNQLETLFG